MRLPRRVPWASLSELDQICNWIYTDESDTEAKLKAVHRLSAWRAITPLPHALEATLSLLSSIILDEEYAAQSHRPQDALNRDSNLLRSQNISALNVRQSYASAIVRLVNGFVDPLQLGAYARSIASIAAQIGLPLWLVDLRHAATHEDLPSLEVLRTGARKSLTWLLHNYFLPTLSASSIEQSDPDVRLSPLHPLVKNYKSLMKTISRDASLRSQYKDELAKSVRDIERWIGEAKAASSTVIFNGWDGSELGEREENERRALERLCEALTDRGGLVPVSSRKRLASNLKSPPVLPPTLKSIWAPLLSALKSGHPTLPAVLVSVIVDILLNNPASQSEDSSNRGLSYELCLAAWAAWCVDEWGTPSNDELGESLIPLKQMDVVIGLVSALVVRDDEHGGSKKGANALLKLLTDGYPQLEDISMFLLAAAELPATSNGHWKDDGLQTMEERLNILTSCLATSNFGGSSRTGVGLDATEGLPAPSQHQIIEMPRGWAQIPGEAWRPCPIGVFRQTVEIL